jgi:hypothetical protein
MSPTQAAQVLAALHGAYPRVELDDAIAAVWQNTLAVTEYDVAMQAVAQWINESRFWPSVAEINGLITSIKRDRAYEQPQLTRKGNYGCDGSGWLDRGNGWEACPTCNPWNHTLIENGDWQNLRQKPPMDWWQPVSCRPRSYESQVFTFLQAKEALERGYREHHAEIGTDPAVVDKKVEKVLRGGLSIGAKP